MSHPELREKALSLRRQGNSYSMILERVKVSKSTLSEWLRLIPYEPSAEALARTSSAQLASALAKHAIKARSLACASTESKEIMGKISSRDLLMLGLGIYMGEGMKSQETIRVVNSDPHILRLAIQWFLLSWNVPPRCFSLSIHIYPDIDPLEAESWWSGQTQIPLSQFGKCQIDRRTDKKASRKGKHPYGTAHLTVNRCGSDRTGVFLHRMIMACISTIFNS